MIPQFKKPEIVNHFKKERYKERTIYNTIERMEDEGSLKDNLRTGRPLVLDTHQRKRLKRLVNNQTGVSQRRIGQKCTFLAINARKLQDIPRNERKNRKNCAGNSPICFTEILAP